MSFSRSSLPPLRQISDLWNDLRLPSKLDRDLEDEFLSDYDLCPPKFYRGNDNRRRTRAAYESSGESEVKGKKDKFQVMLDVSHFQSNEVEVKILDNYIVIHGKHEEKADDHGLVRREFTRRYALPKGAESKTAKSSLSNEGILTVEVPKNFETNVRVVPVIVEKPDTDEEKLGTDEEKPGTDEEKPGTDEEKPGTVEEKL